MNATKKPYRVPRVLEYGSIGEHTFTNPGGHHKTCGGACHVDNFGELAGHPDDKFGDVSGPHSS